MPDSITTITTITLSRLIDKPRYGSISGRCVFCCLHTSKGNPAKFGDNFTAYQYLQDGDCICEYCMELYSNQDYRKKAWILSDGTLEFVKDRKAVLDFLLNPRGKQFIQYITFTWQKQGWLQLIHRLNNSRQKYFVGVDDLVLFVDRIRANDYHQLASNLIKYCYTKTELENGNLSVSTMRKLVSAGLQNEIAEIQHYSRDPLWRLVVKLQA